jgi:2,3-dihydroxybenzoate decarboxylase
VPVLACYPLTMTIADTRTKCNDIRQTYSGKCPVLAGFVATQKRTYDPFWERVQDLQTLIYLHPADPVAPIPVLAGHKALTRATWEWTFETGSHALRLVFGGVFDRFPKVRLALGHLGETLPYLLWRFDSRAKLYGVILPKPPSEYIRENIIVTTSGMLSKEPLMCALDALDRRHVLFATDYPFESCVEAGEFLERAPIDEETRAAICFGNAERRFKFV